MKKFAVAFLIPLLALTLFNACLMQEKDVELPDFKYMEYEDVISNSEYRFEFVFLEDYHPDVPIGQIYDQNPRAGQTVRARSKVTLYVSLGPKTLMLLDVTGMSSEEAKRLLSDLGLIVRQEIVSDDNYERNIVVSMTPEPGTFVQEGSVVTIYTNLPPSSPLATVPDLVGMTLTEAQAELTKNNLRRGTVTYEPSKQPKGTVIKQGFPAGSEVDSSTPIDLVLSNGKKPKKPSHGEDD